MRARRTVTRLRARLARTPRELAVLLEVAGTLGVAWAVVLPPLQGPDEFTHVNYVQLLAEAGRGPYPDHRGGFTVSTEVGLAQDTLGLRNTIGNPNARPAWSDLERRNWDREQKRLKGPQRTDGTGPSPLARNPQLYYAYETVPYL